MRINKLLAKAIAISSTAHEKKFDKGGKPYILHPLWVMDKVRHLGFKYMIVAILHDVVEDTHWTIENLRAQGFPEDVLHSLKLLDFRDKNYDDQIKLIATDSMAREVKLRDLEHNSKVTRLKGLTKKDIDRLEKYSRSYVYLSKI